MARALPSQGVETLIATTDADGPTRLPTQLGVPIDWHGAQVIFFRRQISEAFKYSRPLAAWLGQHVSDFQVAHIHAVFSHACLAAAAACRRGHVPYVVRPLGTLDPWSLQQKRLRKRLLWNAGVRRMLDGAAAIQYTTAAEQRLAEAPLGLRRGVVIPIGIDTQAYLESVDDRHFRELCPDAGDVPYVLFLGRLHPKKGLDLLLEAFQQATHAPELRHWRLVVAGAGDPTYMAQLQRRPRERIVFAGWLAGWDRLAALQQAALLVLPSFQENFALVVAEALACQVPVLISRHVNLAEDVEAAGAGWVVPLTVSALEQALVDVMCHPEERRRRGAAGRALAARFNWPLVASELAGLYRAVQAKA
jgi:glycosyltransferase involved in cell wall biosynthesis